MYKTEIFSKQLRRGVRTYFFDLNESRQGNMFLKISESKRTLNGTERFNLMVFEDDLEDFVGIMNAVLDKMKQLKSSNPSDNEDNSNNEHFHSDKKGNEDIETWS